ncbi:hypothetical protein PG988_002056 [Apiospora saccharicola]
MLSLAQTCKSLSDDVVETLYQLHSYDAIRWACTRGTLYPLRNCLRFNLSFNQYLDVSPQDEPFDYSMAVNTAAVVLFGPTPLILALAHGRFEVAEYLIENGALVNMPEGGLDSDHRFLPYSSRWFPIHFALLQTQSTDRAEGAWRVLKKLLDCGASPNQQALDSRPFAVPRTPLAQVM